MNRTEAAPRQIAPRVTGKELLPVLLTLVIFASLNLVGLDTAPRPYIDDFWYAGFTEGLRKSGVLHHPVLVGRGGIDVAYIQPKLILTFAALPITWLFGETLAAYRFVAVLTGAIGLLGVYLLGREFLRPRATWVLLILCSVSFWFFICSRSFRPEISVFCFLIFFTTFLLRTIKYSRVEDFVIASSFCALTLLSHQIGVLFIGSVMGAALLIFTPNRPIRFVLIIGCLVGLSLSPYFLYVAVFGSDPDVHIWEQLTGEAAKNGYSPASMIEKELHRWNHFLLLPYSLPASCLFLFCLADTAISRDRSRVFCLLIILFSSLSIMLLVPLSFGRYLIPLMPFIMLMILISFDDENRYDSRQNDNGGKFLWVVQSLHRWIHRWKVAVFSFLALLSLGQIAVASFAHREAGYREILRAVQAHVAPNERVAGPLAFWFGFRDGYIDTTVSPGFAWEPEQHRSWLARRLREEGVAVLLETTSMFGGIGGVGYRPQVFGQTPHSRMMEGVVDKGWTEVGVVLSHDYGPIRIWRREQDSESL